ncbi:unnamed protein product [Paramecium octaurelia]|uniref:AAA+ ATPase domain-containing protein n=1 Tax=Paramecium octaurelia TaxID=43137 RepID=A0A8S1TA81_PAROT|nr:unnamed protein product [Paramecium octaurelia]
MSQKRLPSGKQDRHIQAIKKYQEYENSKTSQAKLNDMIKGTKTIQLLPKPGEFVTVASDKQSNQQPYMDIPIKDLLDGTKTFTELKLQSIERQAQRQMKKPREKDRFDEGVLRRDDLKPPQSELDEFGVERGVQPKFTQNIREIMKNQHKEMLAPSEQLIKDLQEKRLPQIQHSHSQKIVRPISANFVIKALNIGDEKLENSKGIQQQLFQTKRSQLQSAKPRNLYVPHFPEEIKHLTGYQTIKLKADDFIQTYTEEYLKEKEEKMLKKHFQVSAVDPRLQSPYMRVNPNTGQIIREKQDELGELELTKHRERLFMAQPFEMKQIFLPLDYYYMEDESGDELIEQYKEKDGKCFGFSKWFDTSGNFTWEECLVEKYIYDADMYEIRFLKYNKTKQVTRVNLRFKRESEAYFKQQLEIADYYRKRSEVFIKYNYMIDKMDDPTSQILEDQLMRIQLFAMGIYFKLGSVRDPIAFYKLDPSIKFNFKRYLIPKQLSRIDQGPKDLCKLKKYRYDLLVELSEEVKKQFIRANHEIQFKRMLPYHEEKKAIFKGYLPEELFEPKHVEARFPAYGIGQQKFIELFTYMKKNLHQAIQEKNKALQDANMNLIKLEEQHLFCQNYLEPQDLHELDKDMKFKIADAIRDLKTRMYDVHYLIMEMIEVEVKQLKVIEEERLRLIVLEAERLKIQEQGLMSETLKLLQQFQKLINIKFERSGLEMWQRSIARFISYLRIDVDPNVPPLQQIYQYAKDREYRVFNDNLLINIEIKVQGLQLILEPNPEEIKRSLNNYVWLAIKELTTVPCMRSREIESAREDMIMHIFTGIDDVEILNNKQLVQQYLDQNFTLFNVYFEKLNEFESILDYDIEKRLKKGSFEEYAKELDKLIMIREDMQKYMFKKKLKLGFYYLNVEQYQQLCEDRLRKASDSLYENLIQKITKENLKIEGEIKQMIQKLTEEPKNLEEMDALRTYAKDQLKEELVILSKKINKVMEKMTLMEKMNYKISYQNFEKTWNIYGMPLKLMRKQEKCLKRLQNNEKKFQEDLMTQQGELIGEINYISKELNELINEEDINQINQIANRFADLGEKMERAIEEADIINRREAILKWKLTDYQEVDKIKKLFTPYYKVWALGRDYYFKIPPALSGPLNNIDRDQLTQDVTEAWTELFKLEKTTFKIIPHMYQVTMAIRKLYEDFKPYLPLINDLRNPALKKQHWVSLTALLKLDDDPNFSLNTLLEKGVMDLKEEIREISETASKQSSFERSINKMKSEWKNIKFELIQFRDTDTHILKSVEPILDKLDEDITKMMSIASSPFVAFLLQEVNSWKAQLFRAQEMIELWCKTQKSWQYLQPIFYSEDIIREMPKEGNKYSVVDKMWRALMLATFQQPLVMEACFQNRMKENFVFMIEQLDQVIKSLNDFLNRKRTAFPRFFFLSNEELLQILAQAREPRAVQRHLQKCFEGINEITFQDNMLITHMISSTQEIIKLITDVNPLNTEQAVRGVEDWLYEVQQSMKLTIKTLIPQAVQIVSTNTLDKSIVQIPAQLCVLAHEIIFTNMVTQFISDYEKDATSIDKCIQQANKVLMSTVQLLHHEIANENHLQALGVLIVLQVKQKDITQELKSKNVRRVDDFEWMSQMRYYLEKDVIVKMLHTQRVYGYEYLGNQSRLVITPLTDRCYRTLMAALHMNLGGAPEGPAGTGKTETTKDLAKAMAKHCVVFNCSDSLDYLAMGKFFKGLVSCGSWACFDEFNRIELEVLSVIAQQILVIQTAIVRDNSQRVPSRVFQFEGQQLTLDSTCAIFITMNPGYQGRSELPDNLKALFRSVAMMIPNYAMITEISLYSYGFTEARELSIKITTSLKLASEQLSTQSHYDFGMRAVKSIILAAGRLKRETNTSDEIIVLRAIEDCNLPKFTQKDVPLFKAIISDLFPGVEPEEREYGELGKLIMQQIESMSLTYNDRFYTKIIQLYETVNVRHGLMVVGGTISGKTTIINILSKSLQAHIYGLNPKSITSKLLYGDVDMATNEWQDGITAVIFRECIEKEGKNWVLFDGPVDALWIENMNTVLDDNKKLCLTNGETIKLTEQMRIIFEVEDLAEASPATVSRCGMVYLEPQEIGWQSLIQVWKSHLTPNFQEPQYIELFHSLYQQLEDVFEELKYKQLIYTASQELLASSCLKLFFAFLLKNKTKDQLLQDIEMENLKEQSRLRALQMEGKEISNVKKIKQLNDKEKFEVISFFFLSVVWTIGTLLDGNHRKQFNQLIRQKLESNLEANQQPPKELSVFEIYFDIDKKNWLMWNQKLDFHIPKGTAFHEIYVPTAESASVQGLLRVFLNKQLPVLLYGRTGTGKTMLIKKVLLDELDQSKFIPTITAFSATTNSGQVQDILESKLEKQKRRKGIYGPEIGKCNIIFIDDLNMPQKEQFGAQPPLELIRQWFIQQGWYDKKSLEFKTIMDIQFCAAMGFGRPNIPQRLVRHFNMIYVLSSSDDAMKYILAKFFEYGFDEYVDKVKFVSKQLPSLCLRVYKEVSQRFLPLPSRSHYLFNLRDLIKVVRGLLMVPSNKYDATGDAKQKLLKLWAHENMRVFSDRLVDEKDHKQFEQILVEILDEDCALKYSDIVGQSCRYGNWLEPHTLYKVYVELDDNNKVMEVLNEYISEFNDFYPKLKLNVVLFEDAIEFICKINRIISQPFGNALLIGLGGTGCRTLSRLSAFMQDFKIGELDFDKDLLEWYEFWREMFKNLSLKNDKSIFLLSDQQIVTEVVLEDINNILNIGEIINLYNYDDKENLLSDFKENLQKDRETRIQGNISMLQLWELFVKQCKANLHLIIYLSPVGDKLKTRLRNFPSLVSCTSILWMESWSQQALQQVAEHLLPESSIAQACVGIHHAVESMTEVYLKRTGYHYYVTPLSYIQLLNSFQSMYNQYSNSIQQKRDTYINGVKMLDECGLVVDKMKEELEALQPILVQKTHETDMIMKKVEQETAIAEDQRMKVKEDEIETSKKAEIAQNISNQCQERLSEAEPQLEAAIKALKTLKISDFVEMKALKNPPKPIRLTMDSVCIMLERKPKKAPDGGEDYWEEAGKVLSDPGKFIKMLEKYNRNNIPEKVITKMTQFLDKNKQFQPALISKASQAAEGLCLWVLAIYKFHFVYKEITPLREEFEKAQQSLKVAQNELAAKQQLLHEVEEKCQELRETFENENFQKQKLKAQIQDCEVKLKRALELTSGLAGEKNRWKEESIKLSNNIKSLLGDMLLSVGYLSYMGAFTISFRKTILNKWQQIIKEQNVPISESYSLLDCLSTQFELQEWILCGLPLDDFSKENAIIMQKADSYPLIIDPQGQANKFIQRKEKKLNEQNFKVAKQDRYLGNILETAVRDGQILLIQGIEQQLDQILDPVLSKQYQMANGKPMLSIGGNQVYVHPGFRLYLVTSLSNPHYTPSILTKVTLINFTITQEALKDQMTSILVREEDAQLEDEKIRIMNDNNYYKQKMKQIESQILEMLSKTEGSQMLEDEALILQLQQSKILSEEITLRLKEAKQTEDRINQNRLHYDLLSTFASHTYFTILKLNYLDPMYVFSLEFYQRIFKKAIRIAEKPHQKNIKQRIVFITESLKRVVFQEISRSIFVKHKNLFSFMLLITWYNSNNLITNNELQFLLTGSVLNGEKFNIENPDPTIFTQNQWEMLNNLHSIIPGLQIANSQSMISYLDDPQKNQIPEQIKHLSTFQRLLLIRAARPQYFGYYMRELIAEDLGQYFTQNLLFGLQESFEDSNTTIPLIFVLQPGDDPQEEVKKFSFERGKVLTFVSLGKGQGENATNLIMESLALGQWVILQNCHLAISWLPQLDNLLQNINSELHKKEKDKLMKINTEFRLWMTTMSTPAFPQQLLMDAVKMTKDPPKGVKDNIQQIYLNQNSSKNEKKFYESCGEKTQEFKQFYLALCYFHAIVRERRRYGPVGWNITYDFNDSDFRISIRQLKQMLMDYQEIPFTALIYLTGECYYGGKVTDDWDRRCLRVLLTTFYRMDIFYENYKFSPIQEYCIPDAQQLNTLEQAIDFINQLPETSSPELFGLHSNASITQAQLETKHILNCLLDVGLVEQGAEENIDKNKLLLDKAESLLTLIPKQFDINVVQEKFKIDYYESMNTVLLQEVLRYNNLLNILQKSLQDLIKAAQGLIVMSQQLEKMGECLLNNILPELWKQKSYPSLKSLNNYLQDLQLRVEMFNKWIQFGTPTIFWLPGFYFTQSFFTGVLQNHARKHRIPIDQLKFDFQIDIKEEEGIIIDGLYLESGKWNQEEQVIDEPVNGVIYQNFPKIQLLPKQNFVENHEDYICPVYKTLDRRGTLSTTGHSTNFIISIPIKTQLSVSHWVKRGTALVTQLNE